MLRPDYALQIYLRTLKGDDAAYEVIRAAVRELQRLYKIEMVAMVAVAAFADDHGDIPNALVALDNYLKGGHDDENE